MKKNLALYLIFIFVVVCVLILWIVDLTSRAFDDVPFISSELIKELIAILQTLIIVIFINRELRMNEKITRKSLDLETQGITEINKNGVMKKRELTNFFLQSNELKICAVCGLTFFKKNRLLILEALKKGTKIKFLISNPNSEFLCEITNHLDAIGSREEGQKINDQRGEIIELIRLIKEINVMNSNRIQVSFFSTEYRVPFYLCYQNVNDELMIKGWYNSIIPVRAPRSTIMFGGQISEDEREKYVETVYSGDTVETRISNKNRNFIFDLEAHFDYVWEKHYEKSQAFIDTCK